MPSTESRYPDNPAKQSHYDRWLAERQVQKEDDCGCEWCLEFARLTIPIKMVGEFDPVSPALDKAIKIFRKRGRPPKNRA